MNRGVPGGAGEEFPTAEDWAARAAGDITRMQALAGIIETAKAMAHDCIETDDIDAGEALVALIKAAAAAIGGLQASGAAEVIFTKWSEPC